MRKVLFPVLVALCAVFLGSTAFAQMHNSGIISGTVTDQATNQPLGAHVTAFTSTSPNTPPVGWAITDRSGHYVMHMAPGTYYLAAGTFGFQPEWWQETSDPSLATAIVVAEDDTIVNINFTLSPNPPPQLGTISGTVTDQGTSQPLFPAMVKASGNNGMMFNAHTDSMGNYELQVPYGNYFVSAEKLGYLREWWQEVPDFQQATAVTVGQDQNPSGINFTLTPVTPPQRGSIAGTITDAGTTQPLAGARVTLRFLGNHHFYRMANSGADGGYIFNDLETGYYAVEAFKEGYLPNRFPDSIYVNGSAVTGIDIALTELIMGTIFGAVTNSSTNEPILGAWVSAFSANDPRARFCASTDSAGAYSLDVPVGMYHMEAHAPGYYPFSMDSVAVGDFAPVNINIALTPVNFGSIAGAVYDTANAPIPGAWVEARLVRGSWRNHARTDSSGQYLLRNLMPGSYILTAHAIRFQPAVYPDTIVVGDGQAVTGIDFHLAPFTLPNGTIAGHVFDDSTNQPIADAKVMAFGLNNSGPRHHFWVRFTRTAADGSYLFERLLSTPYKVMANARGYFGEFYNNKRTWGEADPVTPNATGIDFGLTARTIGPRYLSGMIYEYDEPVFGAIVTSMVDGEIVDVAATLPDGSYEFAEIDAGIYTLNVLSPNENEGSGAVNIAFNDIYEADINVVATSIDDASLPTSISLAQNYPNPFNASTNINFSLANQTTVELTIYDLLGRRVVTLVNGLLPAGQKTVTWEGLDANGNAVASGMYLYVLRADGVTLSKHMALLK